MVLTSGLTSGRIQGIINSGPGRNCGNDKVRIYDFLNCHINNLTHKIPSEMLSEKTKTFPQSKCTESTKYSISHIT